MGWKSPWKTNQFGIIFFDFFPPHRNRVVYKQIQYISPFWHKSISCVFKISIILCQCVGDHRICLQVQVKAIVKTLEVVATILEMVVSFGWWQTLTIKNGETRTYRPFEDGGQGLAGNGWVILSSTSFNPTCYPRRNPANQLIPGDSKRSLWSLIWRSLCHLTIQNI